MFKVNHVGVGGGLHTFLDEAMSSSLFNFAAAALLLICRTCPAKLMVPSTVNRINPPATTLCTLSMFFNFEKCDLNSDVAPRQR